MPPGNRFPPRLTAAQNFSPHMRLQLVMIAVTGPLALLTPGLPAQGQPAFREGFEGPQASWLSGGGDARHQIVKHDRTRDAAHSGVGSERIRLVSENGTAVYVGHAFGRAPVIDELAASVWIKSDRQGMQILARVVLPRSQDPRTGQPLSTFVRGSHYTAVGTWQQLQLANIPQLVTWQARVLRGQFGPQVDEREAYVDQIFLNIYGGPGTTNVWIDDLEVAGVIHLPDEQQTSPPGPTGPLNGPTGPLSGPSNLVSGQAPSPRASARNIEFQGSVLLVGGRTMLPRIIQYQNEPLTMLGRLGFNVARLSHLPSGKLLDEASRTGMWLICPPPSPVELEERGIDARFDSVLAWDMGSSLSGRELDDLRKWALAVRRHDPCRGRPLLGAAEADLLAYSRAVDVLLFGRDPLLTSLELADYAKWTKEQPHLARPGTPFWARIQTQPDPLLMAQLKAFAGGRMPAVGIDEQQIRQLLFIALTSGARGFFFDSQSPLTDDDQPTQRRALALELANLQLDLVEPWAAGGSFLTTASSSDPQVTGAVLQTDRARLLVPLTWNRGSQFAPSQPVATDLSFVVPGVPESNDAYELTPAGLRPLRHKRAAGGLRVWLDNFDDSRLVLMTSDPVVVSSLSQRIARTSRRAAKLKRDLAVRKLDMVESVEHRLASHAPRLPDTEKHLAAARASIGQSDALLATGDRQGAYDRATRATASLAQVQRSRWEQVAGSWGSLTGEPQAVSFATLPQHWMFAKALRHSRLGPNLLASGDFENLSQMLQNGWQHFKYPQPDVRTDVELSPEMPHLGNFSLQLRAHPMDDAARPHLIATPPVWVTSPEVNVSAGQLVRIHGWVRVPRPITGSVDGLLVIDSLGGPALAERIGQSHHWKEFTLYRKATESGTLTVTFALSGLGDAQLDTVTIQPVELVEQHNVVNLPPIR